MTSTIRAVPPTAPIMPRNGIRPPRVKLVGQAAAVGDPCPLAVIAALGCRAVTVAAAPADSAVSHSRGASPT